MDFEELSVADGSGGTGSELDVKPASIFLNLPAEIRSLIFEHLFQDTELQILYDVDWDSGNRAHATNMDHTFGEHTTAILQTCHQCHAEALPILRTSLTSVRLANRDFPGRPTVNYFEIMAQLAPNIERWFPADFFHHVTRITSPQLPDETWLRHLETFWPSVRTIELLFTRPTSDYWGLTVDHALFVSYWSYLKRYKTVAGWQDFIDKRKLALRERSELTKPFVCCERSVTASKKSATGKSDDGLNGSFFVLHPVVIVSVRASRWRSL